MKSFIKSAVFISMLLCLWIPGTAQAHTTINCDSCSYPYQQWVDEAKMPTPDVTLSVMEEPCPLPYGQFAWACTEENAYTIWDDGTERPRETFFHELGHNFDFYVLPQWGRDRFRWILADEREWTVRPDGPNEHFAETYARCAILGSRFHHDPHLSFGGRKIGGNLYRRLCRLVWQFAA